MYLNIVSFFGILAYNHFCKMFANVWDIDFARISPWHSDSSQSNCNNLGTWKT